MDITQLILDDHHEQRRLFAILDQIGDDDVKSLDLVWGRLATFLEVHAEAEEQLFYPALLHLGDKSSAKDETLDAIKDHNEIRDAVAAVAKQKTGSKGWRKAVLAANEANGDHMAEEEREGLSDFRMHADLQTRHGLAVQFAAFEAQHIAGVPAVDKDPKAYVKENG